GDIADALRTGPDALMPPWGKGHPGGDVTTYAFAVTTDLDARFRATGLTPTAGCLGMFAEALGGWRPERELVIGTPRSRRRCAADLEIAGYALDLALIGPTGRGASGPERGAAAAAWLHRWMAPGMPSAR